MSQLSSDELIALQPILAHLAHLTADGVTIDARQIERLLRAADLDPNTARAHELARAVDILSEARQLPDENSRQVAVASLRLRGWLEAPARAAVHIAAGSPAEPQRPSSSGRLKVTPEHLEWTLPVGQVASAQLQVVGGPGSATCDSDQIIVSPARFGSGSAVLQVTVRPLAGSSLLWGNITLSTGTDAIDVPIVTQWESNTVVAGAALQSDQPPQTAVPSTAGLPAEQVQGRATPDAQTALTQVAVPSTMAPMNSTGSRRFGWVAVFVVLAVTAGAIFLINNERSRNPSLSGTDVQPLLTVFDPTEALITPPISTPRFTVNQTSNVHAGPGTEFPIIGQLQAGQSREINRKSNDGSWLEFGYPGQSGWIRQDLVSITGDLGQVQVAEAISQVPTPAGPARITAGNVDQITTLRTLSGQSPYDLGHMAIAPDGLTLATGSSNRTNPAIRIWSVRDGRLMRTIPTDERAGPLAYSPDGSLLAVGMWDTSVQIWSISDVSLIRTLTDHNTIPASLAFSPDGSYLASGGSYGGPGDGALIVWHVYDWSVTQRQIDSWGAVQSLAFSSGGGMLVAGMMDGKMRIFGTGPSGSLYRTADAGQMIHAVAVSPDDEQLVAFGGTNKTVTMMRNSDGSMVHTLPGHSNFVNSIAFSPDGTLLAVGTDDGGIFLWRASDGITLRILIGHSERIVDVAFTPDGTAIVSSAWDNTVRIWGIP